MEKYFIQTSSHIDKTHENKTSTPEWLIRVLLVEIGSMWFSFHKWNSQLDTTVQTLHVLPELFFVLWMKKIIVQIRNSRTEILGFSSTILKISFIFLKYFSVIWSSWADRVKAVNLSLSTEIFRKFAFRLLESRRCLQKPVLRYFAGASVFFLFVCEWSGVCTAFLQLKWKTRNFQVKFFYCVKKFSFFNRWRHRSSGKDRDRNRDIITNSRTSTVNVSIVQPQSSVCKKKCGFLCVFFWSM